MLLTGLILELHVQFLFTDVRDLELRRNVRPAIVGLKAQRSANENAVEVSVTHRARADGVRLSVVLLVVGCLSVTKHSGNARERVGVPRVRIANTFR